MPSFSSAQRQRLVWWALWAAFQIGIVIIYIFVGMPKSQSPVDVPGLAKHGKVTFSNDLVDPPAKKEPVLWQLALIPVLISVVLRWTVLPTIEEPTKALSVMVIGIALAEATCFQGIFIFPSHQFPLFFASAAGIFQFIPIYVGRYFPAGVD